MDSLNPDSLSDSARSVVFTQDYTAKPRIDGVQIIDLRLMGDDGGNFAELVRFNDNGSLEALPDFTPKQASYSLVLPGAIKAFHLHYNQEDVWFIPPAHRMLIGLVDCRKGSPTEGVSMRFTMGAGKAQLLYIPRGVAHGGGNIWSNDGMIFYFVNQKFNLENADEHRLPWDHLGEDFWKMTMG